MELLIVLGVATALESELEGLTQPVDEPEFGGDHLCLLIVAVAEEMGHTHRR